MFLSFCLSKICEPPKLDQNSGTWKEGSKTKNVPTLCENKKYYLGDAYLGL